jgi:hypothetical protein
MNLDFLRPLYERTGGFVSVYLETSRGHEDAPQHIALRWRSARERLGSEGADDRTLAAVADVLTDPGNAAPGRAVFARDGAVLLTEALPGPPRAEIATLAPLPHVLPLLAQLPPRIAHVRVTARHDGGEIVAVTAGGRELPEQVEGEGWPVHKSSVGGWSAARFERNAEEAWDVNAKDLAARVSAAASRVGAELIVVGGDVKAKSLLRDHLGSDLAGSTVFVDHEVPASSPASARAAEQVILQRAAERCRQRFADWQAEQAHRRGVTGLDATIAALRDGAVAEVLLADNAVDTATVWIGPGGAELAVAPDELIQRGVADPVADRADAAVVRALATTSAGLCFLPYDVALPDPGGQGASGIREGICALLRYPAP